MKQEILPFGMSFDLIKDEWQILLQISQTQIAQGIGRRRFDFFVRVVEAFQDDVLKVAARSEVTEVTKIHI